MAGRRGDETNIAAVAAQRCCKRSKTSQCLALVLAVDKAKHSSTCLAEVSAAIRRGDRQYSACRYNKANPCRSRRATNHRRSDRLVSVGSRHHCSMSGGLQVAASPNTRHGRLLAPGYWSQAALRSAPQADGRPSDQSLGVSLSSGTITWNHPAGSSALSSHTQFCGAYRHSSPVQAPSRERRSSPVHRVFQTLVSSRTSLVFSPYLSSRL